MNLTNGDDSTSSYRIQEWISKSDIKKIKYSDCWSDEEQDKNTAWDIINGDFKKMENHLKKTGRLHQLEEVIERLRSKFNRELRGTGADLASGVLWAVPHLLRLGKIELIYCVELSRYRLFKIGPVVLEHYGVPKDKVVLTLGSFYELKLPDNSLDFVFMSAAFHHADDPDTLLAEIRRVLRPDGVVLITVEHITEVTLRAYAKHFLRFFVSRTVPSKIQYKLFQNTFRVKKLCPKPNELFPPDPVLGDHYYTYQQYQEMFSRHGFKMDHIRNRSQAFILFR